MNGPLDALGRTTRLVSGGQDGTRYDAQNPLRIRLACDAGTDQCVLRLRVSYFALPN